MQTVDEIRVEEHTITTRDHTMIVATLFRPLQHNNHTVLISGAMGMPQRFYRHYARYLAEHGCVVLTFDFRGIARSKQRESLWGYDTSLMEWATQDLQAALRWLQRQYPGTTLSVVAHSLGGHLLGAAESVAHVQSLLGISVQNTYWRNWPTLQQLPVFIFWFLLLPLLSYVMGYFPSRWFGMGERLPKHVALDWARGARQQEGNKALFMGSDHDHYGTFIGYTRYYSFSDDTMMAPSKAVDEMLAYYPNATEQERRHITPQAIGAAQIGHNRFFRPEMRDSLWHESLAWLLNPVAKQQRQHSPSPAQSSGQVAPASN